MLVRFPGQDDFEHSKIPTVIYYDDQGRPRATGAETLQPDVLDEAEEERWHKAEW
jgi:hypothetical protein